ncbi:hypothetical protein ACTMTJ_15500 [Phytohabitans sp. LJ34]|uniref:hypothetical protein n=1 Tax=Phytohabitans sp. LJ34 TaxID=3452217 RepID=UPI003F896E7E
MADLSPIGGQEGGQRGQHLLGYFLRDPVTGARDDQALHVVGDEFHHVRDRFSGACGAADGQDGQGQPRLVVTPLVLRDGGVQRAVPLEAAVQGLRVAGEGVDVVADGVVGQPLGGLGGELPAKVDVFPSPDELFVELVDAVEGDVPEPVVAATSPNMSGEVAMTWKWRARAGINSRQAYQVCGQPWTSSSGGPVPPMTTCWRSTPVLTYRLVNVLWNPAGRCGACETEP